MSASEAELRAFVGPQADYYVPAFIKGDPDDGMQLLRWNWAAFFLGPVWLLYRRMNQTFLYYLVVQLALLVVMGMFPTPAVALGGLLFSLLMCCFFGAYGCWLYYRHATGIITEGPPMGVKQQDHIQARGGVRWLSALICVGVMLVWVVGGTAAMRP